MTGVIICNVMCSLQLANLACSMLSLYYHTSYTTSHCTQVMNCSLHWSINWQKTTLLHFLKVSTDCIPLCYSIYNPNLVFLVSIETLKATRVSTKLKEDVAIAHMDFLLFPQKQQVYLISRGPPVLNSSLFRGRGSMMQRILHIRRQQTMTVMESVMFRNQCYERSNSKTTFLS